MSRAIARLVPSHSKLSIIVSVLPQTSVPVDTQTRNAEVLHVGVARKTRRNDHALPDSPYKQAGNETVNNMRTL